MILFVFALVLKETCCTFSVNVKSLERLKIPKSALMEAPFSHTENAVPEKPPQ